MKAIGGGMGCTQDNLLRLGVGGRTGYTTKKRLLLRSLSTLKSQKPKPSSLLFFLFLVDSGPITREIKTTCQIKL